MYVSIILRYLGLDFLFFFSLISAFLNSLILYDDFLGFSRFFNFSFNSNNFLFSTSPNLQLSFFICSNFFLLIILYFPVVLYFPFSVVFIHLPVVELLLLGQIFLHIFLGFIPLKVSIFFLFVSHTFSFGFCCLYLFHKSPSFIFLIASF